MLLYLVISVLLEISRTMRIPQSYQEDPPTPTSETIFSTPSVTHISRKGVCNDNYCQMGECVQLGTGVRSCQCMQGYVGMRCSELMVYLSEYVEEHPETKKKIKVIAHEDESTSKQEQANKAIHIVNQRFYNWSKKQIKKDKKQKKKSKHKKEKNGKNKANKILHNAFQSAFGKSFKVARPNSVVEIEETEVEVTLPVTSKRGKTREKNTVFRSKRDLENESLNSVDKYEHYQYEYNDQLLCITACETVLSYSSQLCPGHKLAVELRIEEHPWHKIPVNKVKCCLARVSSGVCPEVSQAVVSV